MKKSAFLLGAALIAAVLSGCSQHFWGGFLSGVAQTGRISGGIVVGILEHRRYANNETVDNSEIKVDHYGHGVHSDQYGRPTSFEVVGQPYENTSHLQVQQNAYGLGVHADQYGRPVRTKQGF